MPIPQLVLVGGVQGGLHVDESLHHLSYGDVGYLAYLESYDELLGSVFFAFTGLTKHKEGGQGVPLHDAYLQSGLLQGHDQLTVTGNKSILDKFGVFLLVYNMSIINLINKTVVMDFILKKASVNMSVLASIGVFLLVYNIQAMEIW